MFDGLDEFVQLDRTFHDLALSEEEGKDAELFRLMRRDEPLRWPELLKEPRVVLLSEAGSGKTEEVRHVCLDLRARKKHAFFLRIEHLVQDFEASFEEGTLDEFQAWIPTRPSLHWRPGSPIWTTRPNRRSSPLALLSHSSAAGRRGGAPDRRSAQSST